MGRNGSHIGKGATASEEAINTTRHLRNDDAPHKGQEKGAHPHNETAGSGFSNSTETGNTTGGGNNNKKDPDGHQGGPVHNIRKGTGENYAFNLPGMHINMIDPMSHIRNGRAGTRQMGNPMHSAVHMPDRAEREFNKSYIENKVPTTQKPLLYMARDNYNDELFENQMMRLA